MIFAAPLCETMAISGHKTRSVFDRYNIVAERDLHDAARRLEAYHNNANQHRLEKASSETPVTLFKKSASRA